ncbi:TPA: hypothetical protein ACFOIE_002117, partial [Neisseria meningitidis]
GFGCREGKEFCKGLRLSETGLLLSDSLLSNNGETRYNLFWGIFKPACALHTLHDENLLRLRLANPLSALSKL